MLLSRGRIRGFFKKQIIRFLSYLGFYRKFKTFLNVSLRGSIVSVSLLFPTYSYVILFAIDKEKSTL